MPFLEIHLWLVDFPLWLEAAAAASLKPLRKKWFGRDSFYNPMARKEARAYLAMCCGLFPLSWMWDIDICTQIYDYMCIYINIYAYRYTYKYMYIRVELCKHIYIYMLLIRYLRLIFYYIHSWGCFIYTCFLSILHTHTHVCVYIYIYTIYTSFIHTLHACVRTYIPTYLHTYLHSYMYEYVFLCSIQTYSHFLFTYKHQICICVGRQGGKKSYHTTTHTYVYIYIFIYI